MKILEVFKMCFFSLFEQIYSPTDHTNSSYGSNPSTPVSSPPPGKYLLLQVKVKMFGVKVKYFISRSSIFFLVLTLLDFIRPISVVGTSSRSNNKCIICNMREISKYIFSVSCDAEELLSVLGSSSQWQRPSTQTSTSPHFEGGNPLHSLVSPPQPPLL